MAKLNEKHLTSEEQSRLLNITFHASLITAYEGDSAVAMNKIKQEFPDIQDIRPFYKKYGGVFRGHYQDVAGYVIKTATETIVCYRGTKTTYDQYRDSKYKPKDMNFGENPEEKHKIHGGFKIDYDSSKASREEVFTQMGISNEVPIVFTGHSLGGAVAQIAAADYAAKNKTQRDNIKAVRTFGTPRVFTTESAKFYDKLIGEKTIHMMAAGDPIVHVPPASFGFSHTGFFCMMQTSLSGLDSHKRHSYQQVVSNAKNIPIIAGDVKETRKRNLTQQQDGISTRSIWTNLYKRVSSLSIENALQYWTRLISIKEQAKNIDNNGPTNAAESTLALRKKITKVKKDAEEIEMPTIQNDNTSNSSKLNNK